MKKQQISDEALINAILSTSTIKEASQVVGRSERTIFYRLQDDSFRERLERERLSTITEAGKALRQRMSECIEIIAQIASNTDTPPQTRLNACNCIISNALKITEQSEIIKRIERLEGIQSINNPGLTG